MSVYSTQMEPTTITSDPPVSHRPPLHAPTFDWAVYMAVGQVDRHQLNPEGKVPPPPGIPTRHTRHSHSSLFPLPNQHACLSLLSLLSRLSLDPSSPLSDPSPSLLSPLSLSLRPPDRPQNQHISFSLAPLTLCPARTAWCFLRVSWCNLTLGSGWYTGAGVCRCGPDKDVPALHRISMRRPHGGEGCRKQRTAPHGEEGCATGRRRWDAVYGG